MKGQVGNGTNDDFVREYLAWMRKIMCGVVKLAVPVKVDFKVGKKWGELKGYSLEERI
jgi:DNA polymerase I-like protein with 3'-5' exonuclease and polymerase domains